MRKRTTTAPIPLRQNGFRGKGPEEDNPISVKEIMKILKERSVYGVVKKERQIVQSLIQLLENPNESMRTWAARTLMELKDARAVEPLIKLLLEDPNADVRTYTANALGEIGDPRAVKPLIPRLNDQNQMVWVVAESALIKFAKTHAFQVVREITEYINLEGDKLLQINQQNEHTLTLLTKILNACNEAMKNAA